MSIKNIGIIMNGVTGRMGTNQHLGRGMMGDGVIDIYRLRQAIESAGYLGPIEVEIFNQTIWNMPGNETMELINLPQFLIH